MGELVFAGVQLLLNSLYFSLNKLKSEEGCVQI